MCILYIHFTCKTIKNDHLCLRTSLHISLLNHSSPMSYQRPAKRSKTSGESEAQSSNKGSGNTIDVMPESIANNYVIPSMCTKFDISSSGLCAAGGKTLAAGLKGNQVLTELNLANNSLGLVKKYGNVDMSGVIAISDIIPTMRTLTSLDISHNNIGQLVLPEGWTEHTDWNYNLRSARWYTHTDGREQKQNPGKPEGTIAIANAIKNIETLETLFMAFNTLCTKEAGLALEAMLKSNSSLTQLDVSINSDLSADGRDGIGFARGIAKGIKNNGTMTSLNLSDNFLGELVLPYGWTEDFDSDEDEEVYKHTNGREQKEHPGRPEGVIAISYAIPTMKALVKIDISNNLLYAGGSKALADGLKDNQILQELNIASNQMNMRGGAIDWSDTDISGIIAISDAIATMGALEKLLIGANDIQGAEAGKAIGNAITVNTVLKELDISGERNFGQGNMPGCDTEFLKEFAVGLSANGVISNVNILSNNIGVEQANEFIKIMESHSNLKTLCGFSGDETLLDLSNKNLGAGCGVLVANEVKNNRELMILDISKNKIREMVLPKGWSHSYRMDDRNAPYKHTDGRKQKEHPGKPEGAIALIQSMKYMFTECALNKRQWPFIKSNAFMKKEIDALAEALCMNAFPGRKNRACSNERHPLRKPWLLRQIVDYLWGEI